MLAFCVVPFFQCTFSYFSQRKVRSHHTQYIYLYNACIATLLAISLTLRLPCSHCSAASHTPRKKGRVINYLLFYQINVVKLLSRCSPHLQAVLNLWRETGV